MSTAASLVGFVGCSIAEIAEVFDGVHPKLPEQEGVDPVATA